MTTETKKTEAPKSTFSGLKDSVEAIFGGKKGLQPGQLEQLNQYINEFGKAAGVDQPNYKVYKSERDAVLRMIRDNGLLKNVVANAATDGDNGLKVLAAATINAFVQKSQDLTQAQKDAAQRTVQSNIQTKIDSDNKLQLLYAGSINPEKVAKAHNPTFNHKIGNGAMRITLGALTIPGIIGSIKAMFSPKDDGTRKGFWEQVGNLAKAAGFAFVAYNMVYQGRGVQETIDNTRQTIGQWTGMVNERRNAAKALTFGAPVVPQL